MSLENIQEIAQEIFSDSLVLVEQVDNPEIRHIYVKHNITGEQIKKLEENFKILFVSNAYDEDEKRIGHKLCQIVLVTELDQSMTPDQFIKEVYEIAFGEFALPEFLSLSEGDPNYRMPFDFNEVLEKLREFETNSFKVEDLEESEGFTEGDTVKIMGTKYIIHLGNDDEMSLEKEEKS